MLVVDDLSNHEHVMKEENLTLVSAEEATRMRGKMSNAKVCAMCAE